MAEYDAYDQGLVLAYDPLQVQTAIRRILHEAGPSYVTGSPDILPENAGINPVPALTAEQTFNLLTWSHHIFDVEGSVPFIYDRLDHATRAMLHSLFNREFIPLLEFRTELAVCLLLGLTAYCELQLSPLGHALRLQASAVNSLVIDDLMHIEGRMLVPAGTNISSVDGALYNFAYIPVLNWLAH